MACSRSVPLDVELYAAQVEDVELQGEGVASVADRSVEALQNSLLALLRLLLVVPGLFIALFFPFFLVALVLKNISLDEIVVAEAVGRGGVVEG